MSQPFPVYLQERRGFVDAHLRRILRSSPTHTQTRPLADAIRYTTLAEGKRIRPLLAIAVYELFDDQLPQIIAPACAIELIHAASLMLDDLPCMDNASQRRGRPTSHLVFGEATTILASAALWVSAFKLFSQIESIEINSLIKQTAESIGKSGLIRGQYLDISSFRQARTLRQLQASYYLKTAVLFENAVKIGGLLGRATPTQLKILGSFGKTFGLAYQVRDDITDAHMLSEDVGKDVGVDARNGKPTYVSILGVRGAYLHLQKLALQMRRQLESLDLPCARLLDFTRLVTHTHPNRSYG